MPRPIEDYALVGDSASAALIGTDGSIDWWCAPRFDSPSIFAALLDGPDAGAWRLAPTTDPVDVRRRYVGDSLVLETTTETPHGTVVVRDAMVLGRPGSSIVRVAECTAGTVELRSEWRMRFDYGSIVPWVRGLDDAPEGWYGFDAVGGADGCTVWAQVPIEGEDHHSVATTTLHAGDRCTFVARWHSSETAPLPPLDGPAVLAETAQDWQAWADRCTVQGPLRTQVLRSLLTLKALTYAPSGGIVAAATTSLPEWIGSVRNWDYRYCWLRDATFTLHALLDAGYAMEAGAWSGWLRRAVAGDPDDMQIMYGVLGERRLDERELDNLSGYEGSAPVRIGNGAAGQFQLDVYGEVLDMFHTEADVTGTLPVDAVDLARFCVEHVRRVWADPDDGIWEVRGPRRHFVHSKVMAWVAVDRWIGIVDELGLHDDTGPWCELRDEIHTRVCTLGFDDRLGSFTQYEGSGTLDASCLMIPLVGFLPPEDPRVVGTVDAIQGHLLVDGFVARYRTDLPAEGGDDGVGVDGLPPGEGAFLLTTFWLVDCLVLIGRRAEAQDLYDRLAALRNDVGLLAEEYDPAAGRMLGNFPQAFSHVGLINSAFNLMGDGAARGGSLRRRARSASAGA